MSNGEKINRPPDNEVYLPELGLLPQYTNALARAGIVTVADALSRTKQEVLAVDSFGENGLNALIRAIKQFKEFGIPKDISGPKEPFPDEIEIRAEEQRAIRELLRNTTKD